LIDYAAYDAKQRAFEATASRLLVDNKKVLFDLLAGAGISQVIVKFDGYGDSGQVEDIDAFNGDDPADLPDAEVEILSAHWGSADIKRACCSAADAIETMAYDFLSQTHGGWENNDGADGEFVFDVAERSISLDYNERYTATESYSHEF
jgi:hypothetical protein